MVILNIPTQKLSPKTDHNTQMHHHTPSPSPSPTATPKKGTPTTPPTKSNQNQRPRSIHKIKYLNPPAHYLSLTAEPPTHRPARVLPQNHGFFFFFFTFVGPKLLPILSFYKTNCAFKKKI